MVIISFFIFQTASCLSRGAGSGSTLRSPCRSPSTPGTSASRASAWTRTSLRMRTTPEAGGPRPGAGAETCSSSGRGECKILCFAQKLAFVLGLSLGLTQDGESRAR